MIGERRHSAPNKTAGDLVVELVLEAADMVRMKLSGEDDQPDQEEEEKKRGGGEEEESREEGRAEQGADMFVTTGSCHCLGLGAASLVRWAGRLLLFSSPCAQHCSEPGNCRCSVR